MLFDRKARTAPSQYPRVLFHGIRSLQLLSSLVVGGIMSYFIWNLTHEHWYTPWTFIWLMIASMLSILALAVTIVLHCLIGLNPHFNLFINGALSIIWALSWSLLTWSMSRTLANVCDIEHWHEEVGVMVCRIYKALFAFTLIGLVSTIAAFALDIYVRRQQTRLGIYRLHDLDSTKPRPVAGTGPYTEGVIGGGGALTANYGQGGLEAPRHSEDWDATPRLSTGPYDERRGETGYNSVPGEQFGYDTKYSGRGMD